MKLDTPWKLTQIAGSLLVLIWAQATLADEAVDFDKRRIAINMLEEPKTLDPQKASDALALTLLPHINEGLTRLDPRNRPIPAQAESWKRTSKTTYTFKIRTGAKWSDGKQVKADDFVFAWRRGVDPKTASEYAFILYPLKNGRAINEGKMPVEKLGVKAKDELTLEVELERPTGYFLRLLSFGTYFPVRQDFAKKHGESFYADANKILFNGPFKLVEWKHNSSMKLVKNKDYWNAKHIWLNEIDMPSLFANRNSAFNMYKDGKFALMRRIAKEQLPEAQKSKMKIRRYNRGTVWYFQVNTTRKITGNKNFRKAIQVAINRKEFVTQVHGIPGSKPAFGIVPEYMPGIKKRYGDEFSVAFRDGDLKAAKGYLEKAKRELKIKKFPTLTILASDNDTARRDMSYFQRYLKEKLGLEIKLDFQTFKVRLERTDRKDFDIVYSGWGPDYLDAMTFADLFTSWNQNNSTGWKNDGYDKWIDIAMNSVDPKERYEAIHKAEQILVEDAPIIPFLQDASVYVQDARLIGVVRRTISPDPDFYFAKIRPGKKISKR